MMVDSQEFSPSIVQWAADPDGGGGEGHWRVGYAKRLLAHNISCESLRDAWLPRENGVTCPTDLFWCEGCGLSFYNEGAYVTMSDKYNWWRCECCNREHG